VCWSTVPPVLKPYRRLWPRYVNATYTYSNL